MHSVHIRSGEFALLNRSRNVLSPHAVNAILVEEVGAGTFTETEDASEFIIFLSHNMHLNPVKVVIIYKGINSEELGLIIILIQEPDLER
jgi:hypothetical protein